MSGRTWSVVLPLKRVAAAKSRLDLPPRLRRELVVAMCRDTVAAAAACPLVSAVWLVTDEDPALVGYPGVRVVRDVPGTGLNEALGHGAAQAARADPATGTAALTADLAALRVEELSAALASAPAGRGFVADADGTGTTMLTAGPGVDLAPAFGPGSADAHRRSGARDILLPVDSGLRLDVDTVADLQRAAVRGLGPASRALWPAAQAR